MTLSLGGPPRAWGRYALPMQHQTCGMVDPHVRGDGGDYAHWSPGGGGGPPRAWGRFQRAAPVRVNRGWTPTCVGTVLSGASPPRRRCGGPPRAWGRCSLVSSPFPLWPVDPHVRGDGLFQPLLRFVGRGGPPRAWGRCDPVGRRQTQPGWTPTCVGTVVSAGRVRRDQEVDPHVRGDGISLAWETVAEAGGPPRAWGRSARVRAAALALGWTVKPWK